MINPENQPKKLFTIGEFADYFRAISLNNATPVNTWRDQILMLHFVLLVKIYPVGH